MNRVTTRTVGLAGALTVAATGLAATTSASGEQGTVEVWIMGDAGESFATLVEDFTAETGITVEVEAIPWENLNDKLTTAVASGEGPDVVQIGLSNLAAFQAGEALLDLTPLLADHPALADANFLAGVSSAVTNPEGAVLSVPWISDTRVLFYRSDILEEAGVGVPTTWEELHAAATVLAERGEGQYGYYIPQWDQALPAVFTWQAGGTITDETGAVTFDSDEFRTAADFYLSFYAGGLVPTAGDFDQTTGFISGAAPMLISGPYLADAITDAAPELEGAWGIAPLPQNVTGTSLFAGSNIGIWHNSEEVDESLALLDYLSTPETQLAWFEATNQLPTVLAALEDPAIADDPLTQVYAAQLQDAQLLPLVPQWDQIAQELLTTLNGVALNGADQASSLDQLNQTVAEIQG